MAGDCTQPSTGKEGLLLASDDGEEIEPWASLVKTGHPVDNTNGPLEGMAPFHGPMPSSTTAFDKESAPCVTNRWMASEACRIVPG